MIPKLSKILTQITLLIKFRDLLLKDIKTKRNNKLNKVIHKESFFQKNRFNKVKFMKNKENSLNFFMKLKI